MFSPRHTLLSCVTGYSSLLCRHGWTVVPLFAAALQATATHAQTVPDAARLDHLEERITPYEEPEIAEPPAEDAPPAFSSAPPEGAEDVILELKQVNIEGVTVYSPEELSATYEEYLDKTISVAALYEVADRITRRYRADGYVLSRAALPAQEIDSGIVTIRVVEGYVAHVRFTEPEREQGVLKDLADNIEAMRPLHMPTLEKMLLAFNQDDSLQVRSVIEPLPPEEAPEGAVGVALSVTNPNFLAAVRIDNEGSRFIGPWQQTVDFDARDVLIPYDTVSVREMGSAPTNELKYGSVSYTVPLSPEGTNATIEASLAHSEPGFTLQHSDIRSDSIRVAVSVEHPWILTRDERLSTELTLERKDVTTTVLGSELYHDRFHAIRASVSGQYTDMWDGLTLGSITYHQGMNLLGTRKSGSVNLSRTLGKSDFTKFDFTLNRVQALSEEFTASLLMNGQYTPAPLLSSEQCSYGGGMFGRAYDGSEMSGDNCIMASVEIRYIGWDIEGTDLHIAPFGFYDIGKVWKQDVNDGKDMGASAGSGVRVAWSDTMELQLSASWPLTRDADTPQTYTIGEGRYGVRLIARY